jgi:hypothetical protein
VGDDPGALVAAVDVVTGVARAEAEVARRRAALALLRVVGAAEPLPRARSRGVRAIHRMIDEFEMRPRSLAENVKGGARWASWW